MHYSEISVMCTFLRMKWFLEVITKWGSLLVLGAHFNRLELYTHLWRCINWHTWTQLNLLKLNVYKMLFTLYLHPKSPMKVIWYYFIQLTVCWKSIPVLILIDILMFDIAFSITDPAFCLKNPVFFFPNKKLFCY